MASRGRGRKVPAQSSPSDMSSPGGMQGSPKTPASPMACDPIGEAALAECKDLCPLKLAPRPNFGTRGKEIKLITNHFQMTLPPTRELYHYDVLIEQGKGNNKIVWTNGKAFGLPKNEIRDKCYLIFTQYVKQNGLNLYEIFYDRQKSLYTLNDLKELGQMKTVTVQLGKETFMVQLAQCNPYTVTISPETIARSALDTSNNSRDRSPLQILDLITNQFLFYLYSVEGTKYIHFGRYFYRPKFDNRSNDYHYLPYGRMVYEGFFKSLRLVLGPSPPKSLPSLKAGETSKICLTVNVDSKKAPFFTNQNLLNTVCETLNFRQQGPDNRPLNDNQIKHLNTHLRDVRVNTVVGLKRGFVLCTFTNTPACKQMLDINGRPTSVVEYWEKKYNIRIKFPMLPAARKRGERGNPRGFTYYPIEVCEVVSHQKVDLKKTTEEQSQELIKCSAVPPEMRLRDVIDKAKNMDCNGRQGQCDPFCQAAGIERDPEPMKLSGRVLETPRILYGADNRNNSVDVRNGQWNLQGQRVFIPAEIGPFSVCCFGEVGGDKIQSFTRNLILACRNLGIKMSTDFNGDYVKESNIDSVFKHLSTTQNRTFLICIMDDRSKGDKLKNAVKLAEVKYTVVTQCVRPKSVFKCADRPNDQIYVGLALKINLKNGGINNEIDVKNDPIAKKWFRQGVMYMGMDVNHPPPQTAAERANQVQPKEPSVVGAVANCGKSISDYRMQYYLQDMRQEEVQERHIKDMVDYFVNEYAANDPDKKRPESIIFYRDGVSESQFKMVLDKEVCAMKQAFATMTPPYDPKLTVITVQKRHNTRFFQERLATMSNDVLRNMKNVEKNIPAGTVVDVGPVSAHLFDFFLCSHVGIQGTSKPTYYVILLDENKFSADELQHLTFVLCHGYQRCTKSVSLPAPVYHAHHVASRGKANFLADNNAADDSSSGISSASSEGSPQRGVSVNYEQVQSRIQYGPLIRDRMIWA